MYKGVIYTKQGWLPEVARCSPASIADRRRFGGLRGVFDWLHPTLQSAEAWKITRPRRLRVEGLVAFEAQQDFVLLRLLEVHPRNRGQSGQYFVTGALLAVVAQRSVELGFGGHFAFKPKTTLWDYYVTRFGASAVSGLPGWLQVQKDAAAVLIDRYLLLEP